LQVFQDANCSIEMGHVLFEGTTYYLTFSSTDPRVIEGALAAAGLQEFVTWSKKNLVATLRVVNRIGLVRLFGKEFDIRSAKFLENETGARQFKILLDDLAELSRHIVFASSAAPGANRIHAPLLDHPSTLERFNYYRQTCFKKDGRLGLAEFVDQIVRNPHNRLVDERIRDHIWNAKRPSRQTLNSSTRSDRSFARLPDTHPLGLGRPGLKITGTADILFPLKALRSSRVVSIDTAENRFVKHVLQDIEDVSRLTINDGLLSGALLKQCHDLLNLSRALLRHRFFQEIGRLQTIPFSSPTLGIRHGYRDIYRIFMRSRMGAKHLFENLADDALAIELKDVSLLYEYWVFYKLASILFEPGALFLNRTAIIKGGRIVNAAVVSDGQWTVHFNRTYARKPSGSYSLGLRPDIVIERLEEAGGPTLVHVLDAKYKSVQYTVEDDEGDSLFKVLGVVKSADIHKMHCYIDAIEGVQTATAVYPGHSFVFYPRERSEPAATAPAAINTPAGVGAVPLMPGSSNDVFSEFVSFLKSASP
jgi:uncharacterized protein